MKRLFIMALAVATLTACEKEIITEEDATVSDGSAIEKTKKKLAKLKELYINDMIDIQEYKKDYDDLNKQLADLAAEAIEEETPVDVEAIKILLSKSTEEIYQTLTAEDRRKFWRSFIDKIVVHSRDNMEIIFLRKGVY